MFQMGSACKFACALFIGAILTVVARSGQAQTSPTDFRYLFTDKEAVLLLPPELVAGPNVVNMDWSPDSQNVVTVCVRQPMLNPAQPQPPAELSVVVWNGPTLHAQESWKKTFPLGGGPRDSIRWLPTTLTAFQEIYWMEKTMKPGPDNKPTETMEYRQALLIVDSQRGFVREIPETDGDAIFISPTRPLSVIIHNWPNFAPDRTYSLTTLRSDGALSHPTPLPEKMNLNGIYWSEDGRLMNLVLLEKLPDKKGVLPHWIQFNPQTGTLTPLSKKPTLYQGTPKPPQQPFTIQPAILKAQQSDTVVNVPALWLETSIKSERPRTLISADAKNGILAPNGNAILYNAQGAAWVIPLCRVSKADFKLAQIKSQRMIALNNAKQLALGLIMWAMDHDEALPTQDNVNAEIEPYLKNDSLYDGFTYTYKGGPLADIAQPAETEIGTVDGPGGVAILYADGHTRWINR